mgnify:CR=1 FL=1
MAKGKATCVDSGLYKAFMNLLSVNTSYMKNIDRSSQMMFSQETSKLLINCAASFIKSFNSFSPEKKLENIHDVKDSLLAYDLIIRVLADNKILSIQQISTIGETIASIQAQLSGFEKKINTELENS